MSHCTLLQRFKKQVEKQGDKPAVIEPEGRKISYSELDRYAGRIAEKMRLCDVRQNDTVALVLPAGIDAVAAMLASLKLGAAFAVVNGRYPKERLEYIYKDCSAALVVTPEFFADAGSCQVVEKEAVVSDEDTAALVYTSGSTGNPKGVLIDQRFPAAFTRSSQKRMFLAWEPRFSLSQAVKACSADLQPAAQTSSSRRRSCAIPSSLRNTWQSIRSPPPLSVRRSCVILNPLAIR